MGVVPWVNNTAGDFDPQPSSTAITEQATLFEPKWTRSILSTALGVQAPIGRIDLAAVVQEAARARPLRYLPRLPGNTISPSVQILMDVGDPMIPFLGDQQALIPAIERVVGFESTRVLKFTANPLRGAGTDEDDTWPPYTIPPSGTQVLRLTDFGIGQPPLGGPRATFTEWQSFANGLHRRKVSCTAFVPYPPERWPRGLSRLFRLVEWDRDTTTGRVKFSRKPTLR